MKVNTDIDCCFFKDLNKGDVFMFGSGLYIVTEHVVADQDVDCNCVNLESGMHTFFFDDSNVIRLGDAEVRAAASGHGDSFCRV